MKATIQTVLGAVPVEALGVTLPHEHIFCNLQREHRATGLLSDEQLIVEELLLYEGQGGRAVVDLTPAELTVGANLSAVRDEWQPLGTRQPGNVRALERVAEATGLHIIASTGHYRDPYLDREWFDRHSVDAIAEVMIKDLTDGFPGTDVRAGVIGEIGCDKWYLSTAEERSFRAAARAHLATGAAIHTHAAHWAVGEMQLDLLEAEGVDPRNVAIGHVDLVREPGYALRVAARGAYVGIDTIFTSTPSEILYRATQLQELIEAGFADRILLSQDVCMSQDLRVNGGGGFSYAHGEFRDFLRKQAPALSDETFQAIITNNPQRFLAGVSNPS